MTNLQTGRIDLCRVVQVVEVHFIRGKGVVGDPVRQVRAYYTPDGDLLAEVDSWTGEQD